MINTAEFFKAIKKIKYFPKTFQADVLVSYPKIRVRKKQEIVDGEGWHFLKAVAWFFRVLGKIGIDVRFMERTTTIRYTIYLGSDWDARTDFSKYALIRHELVHLRQYVKWRWAYSFSYLIFPLLPAGLSMRAYWEWQAFKTTLVCYKEFGVKRIDTFDECVERYTGYLCNGPYMFAAWFVKPLARRIVRKFIAGLELKHRA